MSFRSLIRNFMLLFLFTCSSPGILKAQTNEGAEATNPRGTSLVVNQEHSSISGPVLVFKETEHDFGQIFQFEKVRYTFAFENLGTSTLEIFDVSSSCGCTAALASSNVIEPSSGGTVEAIFDAGRMDGSQSKKIRVKSNDPVNPEIILTVHAKISPLVEIEPEHVYFSEILKGEEVEKTLTLRAVDGEDLEIRSITPSNASIGVDFNRVKEENNVYHVQLHIKADMPVGPFNERIQIETSSVRIPEVIVPVRGLIRGEIVIRPASCFFRVVEQGEEAERIIVITKAGNPDLKLMKPIPDIEGLQVELQTVDAGKRFELIITLSPRMKPGRLMGNIKIATNNKDQSILSIPVGGYIRAVTMQDS